MASIALGQLRRRPAAFVGLAAALFLAIATVTLFGSLVAAEVGAPTDARKAPAGPGLMVIAGAFAEIAVLVALFVVVNALGFALRQQHRELALLRTVAATPRQARRLVRGQVVATALLVAAPGWVVGAMAARGFLAELQRRGMAAPGVRVPGTPVPMLVALAVALVVGLAASAVAARRISRIAPAAALTASATEHGRTGALRLLVGIGALVGGGLLLRLAATRPAEQLDKAGQAALFGALVLLVAVALAGPLAARVLAVVLGAPVRALAPGTGWLADANLRGYARRLSSAVVPVALLVGLSGTMSIMTRTAEYAASVTATATAMATGAGTGTGTATATGVTSGTDVWLRQAELALLVCFAAVSTVNTLVAVTADRRREFALLRLVGATRAQLLRMLTAEAVLTTAVGVLLGAAVAGAASAAFSTAVTGSAVPAVPAAACGWIVAGAAALTIPGILGTGLRTVRGPATEVVGGGRD
ncbi:MULTISPECIES: FtsX-like permease family protein [unclassified Streptomyces]|uniref:FtsX-like permease family protein n=1 Tax=unclassified Streptomyces TaxID=2593676 RepID=UPI000369D376|nr:MULTISPECIES: FtsX-like permease family protein [unclassified Streptomyces]MYT28530.1 FtsX-like permease family protein [Streptomyces sp. SID8354]